MQKTIRDVDETRGIVQVTIADERWYLKTAKNSETGLPEVKAVPSVTWITQSYPKGIGYYKWLSEHGWDEAEAIKTAAGDKGTKVHLAIEDILQGKEVRIDSKYINKSSGKEEELTLEECDAVLSFLKWKNENNPQLITFETTVFSDQYNYAGTIDYICKIGDEFWIIDFKTSQQVWPSHELQLNAYRKALENGENHIEGLDVTNLKIAILQVGYRRNKDGFKFTEIEEGFDMFLTAQKIWKKEHGDEQPKKKDYPIVLSPGLTLEEALGEPTIEVKKATKKTK